MTGHQFGGYEVVVGVGIAIVVVVGSEGVLLLEFDVGVVVVEDLLPTPAILGSPTLGTPLAETPAMAQASLTDRIVDAACVFVFAAWPLVGTGGRDAVICAEQRLNGQANVGRVMGRVEGIKTASVDDVQPDSITYRLAKNGDVGLIYRLEP